MSDYTLEIALGIFALLAVLRECVKDPSPGDGDRASDKERQKAIADRQQAAREAMKAKGIKSLHEGHEGGRTGWQKINPMAEVEPPPMAAKVTPIRRTR